MNKVAEITVSFWLMKILATTLGETFGDYISMTLGFGYYTGLAITFSLFLVVVVAQVKADRHYPVLFWLVIIATTTAGTEISDLMDRSLGLGYVEGSILLVVCLAAVLAVWHYRDGTLRVYPIVRKDAEITFWLAVLISNSLGTAFGDFLVDNAGLGYVQGALVTSGVILVVLGLHYFTRMNEIALFWIAFIFTRPFGATFGDFLTKPVTSGGLDIPRDYASLITLILLLSVLTVSVSLSKRETVRIDD